jgi:hypothetical protein
VRAGELTDQTQLAIAAATDSAHIIVVTAMGAACGSSANRVTWTSSAV